MLILKQSETKVKGNSSRYLRNALVGVTDTLCRSQLLMEDVEWFMGRSSVEVNGGSLIINFVGRAFQENMRPGCKVLHKKLGLC